MSKIKYYICKDVTYNFICHHYFHFTWSFNICYYFD